MSDTPEPNPDPLRPSESLADWEAQGWSSEPIAIDVAPRLATTLSIRFDPNDARVLRRAARMKGVTKSEFVRWSTIKAATHCIETTPPVTLTVEQPAAGSSTASISSSQSDVGFSVERVSGSVFVGPKNDDVITRS